MKNIFTLSLIVCLITFTQCGLGSVGCAAACAIGCAGTGPFYPVCYATCMTACLVPTACFD